MGGVIANRSAVFQVKKNAPQVAGHVLIVENQS
jgi:hypothetical protein